MSEAAHESGGAGPSHRSVEVGVAIAIVVLALIGIVGATRVGIGWGAEGPRAGFFPFYICLAIIIASAVNLTRIFMTANEGETFATWSQLRQVASVVVPTAIYVFIIPSIGIYVASMLLIGSFMMWFGKYRMAIAVPLAIGVPIFFFVTFEFWFLVPLPKGPLEHMLGY